MKRLCMAAVAALPLTLGAGAPASAQESATLVDGDPTFAFTFDKLVVHYHNPAVGGLIHADGSALGIRAVEDVPLGKSGVFFGIGEQLALPSDSGMFNKVLCVAPACAPKNVDLTSRYKNTLSDSTFVRVGFSGSWWSVAAEGGLDIAGDKLTMTDDYGGVKPPQTATLKETATGLGFGLNFQVLIWHGVRAEVNAHHASLYTASTNHQVEENRVGINLVIHT